MKTIILPHKAPGFTLVELMVAITIGLIVLGVLSQVYVGSKRTYRVQEALSRLQENGRYSIDFVGREIRLAGYMGCVGTSATLNSISNPIAGWTPINMTPPPTLEGIIGYEQAGVPASGFPVVPLEVKTDTDVIEVQYFTPSSAKVTTQGTANKANTQISGNALSFQTGEVLIVTNCTSADIFTATTVSNGTGTVTIAHASNANTTNFTVGNYTAGNSSEVMRIQTSVYYISSGSVAGGCPADSLCRKRLGFYLSSDTNKWCTNATSSTTLGLCVEQVAEGVEDLQVLYGLNTTGSPTHTADRFVNAAAIATNNCGTSQTCWPNVVSTRINFLLRTVDTMASPDTVLAYPASQIALFNGRPPTITTPRAIRRVYTETVVLRNRAL